MDIAKMGSFLGELRREKGMTQENLAEKLYVSSRTISRWESGKNMPDIETLLFLAEFYDLELIEILNGERKEETMKDEIVDTSLKVSEYEQENNKRIMKRLRVFFIIGFVGKMITYFLNDFSAGKSSEIISFAKFFDGFFDGFTIGMLVVGILFTCGAFKYLRKLKESLLNRKNQVVD